MTNAEIIIPHREMDVKRENGRRQRAGVVFFGYIRF